MEGAQQACVITAISTPPAEWGISVAMETRPS